MSNLIGQTREDVINIASEFGLTVFFANPDELFIDLDPPVLQINKIVRSKLIDNHIVQDEITTTSKSGGLHVYMKLNMSLDYKEAAALQAALGSDPVREALTILTRDFSCLFETEIEAKRVQKWRENCRDIVQTEI